MSRANNREHRLAPVALLLVAACGGRDPSPCPALSHALDQAGGLSGRALIVRVDEALRTECADPLRAARGTSSAHQLARARLQDDHPVLALRELGATFEPAIALRRAELLERLDRIDEARAELDRALALAPDADALAARRLLDVSAAARHQDLPALARLVAAAPLPDRPRLAHRAAADLPPTRLGELTGTAELAIAAGDRLEELEGPAAAVAARERAVVLAPDLADAWDALARSRIAAGRIDDALAAWDRAIAIAPEQEAYRIAPIRALVIAQTVPRAQVRAAALAADARAAHTPERLIAASAGAAAVDPKLALALAREAQALRPLDGRLAFLVAQRLAEAGDPSAAARTYADLLVCGAHGHPWHRHEVAAKLQELGAIARAALDEKRACDAAEPADLAHYVDALRAIH